MSLSNGRPVWSGIGASSTVLPTTSSASANVVSLQLLAQRREVVELAVEHGDDVAGFVRHGLVPGLRIDDDQPLVAEDAAAGPVGRAVVGAAVDDCRAHPVDESRIGCAV